MWWLTGVVNSTLWIVGDGIHMWEPDWLFMTIEVHGDDLQVCPFNSIRCAWYFCQIEILIIFAQHSCSFPSFHMIGSGSAHKDSFNGHIVQSKRVFFKKIDLGFLQGFLMQGYMRQSDAIEFQSMTKMIICSLCFPFRLYIMLVLACSIDQLSAVIHNRTRYTMSELIYDVLQS